MAFTLQEVLQARSAATILNDWLAYLANPPAGLTKVRTSNWRTGGPYLYLIRRFSQELELLYKLVAALGGSAFIRYATGLWLKWLGEDFFGEEKQGATFATVNVTLTSTAGFGPYGPQIIKVKATNGKTYSSLIPVTIPLAGTITTGFRADAVGAASNVGAGQINALVSPNVLGVTVSNAAAVDDGYDEEDDDRYKARLLAKWGILSGAVAAGSSFAMVRDGFIYGALTAHPEVKKVAVLSSFDGSLGVPASNTETVVIAGDGVSVSPAAVAAVGAYLAPRIGLDETLKVIPATVVTAVLLGLVKVRIPYAAVAIAGIASGLKSLDVRVPIGGGPSGVPQSEFTAAIFYDPLAVYDADLAYPAAGTSIPLSFKEILVTDPTALTYALV